ncbi:ribonuclease HII [Atopobacter phocae]|uniref:ribonuclease HII n=1 Tax=Atopobacter phocae TaxID=136492 RepID=UPI000470879A|nr:ribonuclease HII [Atopobacter phocae]
MTNKSRLTLSQLKLALNQVTSRTDAILVATEQDERQGAQKLVKQTLSRLEKVAQRRAFFEETVQHDIQLTQQGQRYVIGVDEVGRGPLAGPVVVAAVILPLDQLEDVGFDDSKRLTLAQREQVSDWVKEHAVKYQIVEKDAAFIDTHNILEATRLAMKEAVLALEEPTAMVLVDALTLDIPHDQLGIIKGDQRSVSIQAASSLAKVYRDELMIKWSQTYPGYDFEHNMGYGTQHHLDGLKRYGATPIHRRSFEPIKSQY